MRRPGEVVYIRINPRDCMSVIDVLRTMQVPTANMSFAHACKIALASSLESLRQQGVIPTRQGFEFEEMMAPFRLDLKERASKLKLAELTSAPEFVAPAVVPESPEKARRRLRYEELVIKKNSDPINFGPEEQEELRPLIEEFFS